MESTAEPGVYKLYLSPGLKLQLGLVGLAFAGVGIAMIGVPLLVHTPKAHPPLFWVFFLAVICIVLFSFLRLPHRITLAPDGAVEFISILRRRMLRARRSGPSNPHPTLDFSWSEPMAPGSGFWRNSTISTTF